MAEFCLITPPIGLNCFVVASAPEYRALFGTGTHGALALYRHDHNHTHDHDNCDHSHQDNTQDV
jgi:zinc transport system ATP-binding protein